MREIKFRAFHRKHKILRSVLMMEINDPERNTILAVRDHPSENAAKIKISISKRFMEDVELMQYT
jgi:hypothetical protein